jgi:6,7-dimethyl-8-ribityllumazine synthase|tara:strand:+ start:519 stop:911 length:393 start_codon:yes stop_codon:yes gene_type:complete
MKKKPNILIVRSIYNLTNDLVNSALLVLEQEKINWEKIEVNGAFEIPVTIARNINKFDGFIAIGVIIKGETPNFSLISQAITNGLMELSISNKKPIGNAILTCLTKTQAAERILKGEEAAKAVIDVLRQN